MICHIKHGFFVLLMSIVIPSLSQNANNNVTIWNADTFFVVPDSVLIPDFQDLIVSHGISLPNGRWFKNSVNQIITFSILENRVDGECLIHNQEGVLQEKIQFSNGAHLQCVFYDQDGAIRNRIYYDGFGNVFETQFYYSDENLKSRFINVSDTIDYATEYYQDGKIKSTGTYFHMIVFDNKWKVGFWSYWDENGKLTHTETFNNWSYVRNYFDKNGDWIKSEYYVGYELIKSSTKFEYDEFGNIKGKRK